MKKKLFSLLSTIAMAATLLSGCGNDDNKPSDDQATGKKVGFTVPSISNDFMLEIVDTVKEALEAEGVSCQVDSADGDVTKQIEQIENYATMGMDLIVVLPINGEALTSVCQKVMNDGIPVFAYAMEIPDGATTQMLAAEEYEMGEPVQK